MVGKYEYPCTRGVKEKKDFLLNLNLKKENRKECTGAKDEEGRKTGPAGKQADYKSRGLSPLIISTTI